MATIKKALKSIKSKLEAQEPEAALFECTELLKSIDPKSPEAISVYVAFDTACPSIDSSPSGHLYKELTHQAMLSGSSAQPDRQEG
jgi:hypothetical protein